MLAITDASMEGARSCLEAGSQELNLGSFRTECKEDKIKTVERIGFRCS